MAKVKLENITKTFGNVVAVNNLSLEIEDGEFMVLLGPSGAGKTTTLKLISGNETPEKGLIYIGNRIVNPLEPQQRNVAMAFESYALYPHFTVYENLAFPLKAPGRNYSTQQIDNRVKEVAELLNITPLLSRAPAHLSGGQRQRVSLGRALVRDPDILLLDEPISHLDAKLRHRMRAEFKAISSRIKTTILYVTHDYLEAMSLPDRVAIIDHGTLHQVGSPEDVFRRPANIFVASLLGQPKINLIKCRISNEDGKICFTGLNGGVRLLTNDYIRDRVLKTNLDHVIIGIRPFNMIPVDEVHENETIISGKVYVYERLGTRGILTFSVENQNFDLITPISMDFKIDAPVNVKIDVNEIMIFDPTTEKNIFID
jgi:ABC-type sugar transport system ATPase subunit